MVTALNETIVTPGGTSGWGKSIFFLVTSGKAALIMSSVAVVPDTDVEQAYFWTSTWQTWENEADEDLKEGRYADFEVE